MYTLQLSSNFDGGSGDEHFLFLSNSDADFILKKSIKKPRFSVVSPYGLAFEVRDLDLEKSEEYFERILVLLSSVLNEVHDINLSIRQWEILLGHWLKRYIAISINTCKKMELAWNTFEITHVVPEQIGLETFAPLDTADFTGKLNDPAWALVFKSSFYHYWKNLIPVSESQPSNTYHSLSKYRNQFISSSNSLSLKRKILLRLQDFVSSFSRNVLSSTYLPRGIEWGLALRMFSVPQGLKFQKSLEYEPIDRNLRLRIRALISEGGGDDRNLSAIQIGIASFLPNVFLESFNRTKDSALGLKLPNNPKYIFTSNDFDSNELFKFWLVSKIGNGSKYIVGQHGNNYGTSKYLRNTVEQSTADKFITWGWSFENSKYYQGFNLRNPRGKRIESSDKGRFLLAQTCYPIPSTTWDSDFEFEQYLDHLGKIVQLLHPAVRKNLTLRLHPAETRLDWSDVEYWSQVAPDLDIDKSGMKIVDLYPKFRLVIHGYDSTGILETLSANYPTLGFLPNGLNEMLPDAQGIYNTLVEAGILHSSPESLALKVNAIADDVENWWNSSPIQFTREKFVYEYARTSKSPITQLKRNVFK